MVNEPDSSKLVENQAGTVGFRADLNRFTIGFTGHGSVDAQTTAVITGVMPEAFRSEGIQVVFSGKLYRDADTPRPRFGGEHVVWLRLSGIARARP